jgi:DNA-binding NtrC family response regulator
VPTPADSPKARVLVVDDEPAMRDGLRMMLAAHDVSTANDGEQGLAAFAKGPPFDVVITDLRMPGKDGMEVLKSIKQTSPGTIVIMISAHGDIATAVQAMQLGAADFVQKPFKIDDVRARIRTALDKRDLARPKPSPKGDVAATPKGDLADGAVDEALWKDFPEIISRDPAMARVLLTVRKVAPSHLPVLVLGETGTGKELISKALHRLGQKKGPCLATTGQLPASLVESELFGHVKGAFTGAVKDKAGYFEAASGGTFFLDEVGDLPMAVQVKLLRVIQEREVVRIGESKPRKIDARLVAATNKDLPAAVKAKEFREDLLFRLNVITVVLPPLRERGDDVLLLARHFLAHEGKAQRTPRTLTLSEGAVARLRAHRWPGNVRELQHVCQSLSVLAPNDEISADDVSSALA